MKTSPLQLDLPEYPEVSVRAIPRIDEALLETPLPVVVHVGVSYEADGKHFAFINIRQEDERFPYVLRLDAFCTFSIDVEGCRAAYKTSFNPGVIGANVGRILFSGARELISFVTSRSPWGAATLPSLMIEPGDVELQFEDGKLAVILEETFGFSKDRIQELQAMALAAEQDPASTKKRRKAKAKSQVKD